jgi:putative transcriptional regulator
VKRLRQRLKLSQDAFARRYGIPVGTLRDWEQARRAPDACGRAFLAVIARAPEIVPQTLRAR